MWCTLILILSSIDGYSRLVLLPVLGFGVHDTATKNPELYETGKDYAREHRVLPARKGSAMRKSGAAAGNVGAGQVLGGEYLPFLFASQHPFLS